MLKPPRPWPKPEGNIEKIPDCGELKLKATCQINVAGSALQRFTSIGILAENGIYVEFEFSEYAAKVLLDLLRKLPDQAPLGKAKIKKELEA